MTSEVFWLLWNALATSVLVVVGYWQITAIRRQAKKERTLNACERYVYDPILDASARTLREARLSGVYKTNQRLFRTDVVTLLNYLDGIAIGIAQNLYIDALARDHLQHIVRKHCDEYLYNANDLAALEIDRDEFQHLEAMQRRWTDKPRTAFRDGLSLPWQRRQT